MEQLHNLMEDIVLRYVDGMMEAGGGCCCPDCRRDIMAYALNHLPPRYVASDKGRMLVQLDSYDSQFRTDVTAALGAALSVVWGNPRHQ